MTDQHHQHGPDCDHDHETDVVILTDDDGNEHEFIIVDVMTHNDKNYAILVPNDEAEGDAVIFRLEEAENGEEYLVDIEDDTEWNEVVKAYEQYVESMED
jgi:uncharacterized protein YrzB (UPF0473 family)